MSAVMESNKKFVYGEVQGRVILSDRVKRKAAEFCAAHFAAQRAIDFCGERVEPFATPAWAPARAAWLPASELRALGFIESPKGSTFEPADQLIVTIGVDAHEDSHGPMLCMVLHNDGLKFRQGKVSHVPMAGDWFVFNDLLPHVVNEANGEAVWASVHVPLQVVA